MDSQRIAHYVLLQKIGSGGMGDVYRARHAETDALVALKVLQPHSRADEQRQARFRREARAYAMLDHPAIARLYEFGEAPLEDGSGSVLYLAMELASGNDLQRRFAVSPPTIEQALAILRQIAEALAVAHAAGVIHRDLKPSNVRIDSKNRVKILDFGLARIQEADRRPDETEVTTAGQVVGTTHYIAPEIFGGKPADARSDLYALGTLIYQVITGRLPFSGANLIDYLHEVTTRDPAPMVAVGLHIPRDVQRIVRKLIQRKPADRYQSAEDLLADLDRLDLAKEQAEDATLVIERPSEAEMSKAKSSVSRGMLLAVFVLMAVAVAVVLLLLRGP